MNGNKNRPMETISRNFKEGGEIVIKIDYEESPRTEPEEERCKSKR